MRVELGVLVTARQVPEPRRHQPVRRGPRALPRRRVVAARLEQRRFDPVERRPDRRVVGAQNPPVAVAQRFQRYRLGRGQREVEPRPVLVLPVKARSEQRRSAARGGPIPGSADCPGVVLGPVVYP